MDTPAARPTPNADTDAGWQVVCLCAAWCGTCRDWRAAFEQAAAARPGMRFAWVDIEDEADALGEVDVETFPTLLVAHGGRARFYGPVLPQPAQVDRLLASLQHDGAGAARVAPEAQGLLDRLNDAVL